MRKSTLGSLVLIVVLVALVGSGAAFAQSVDLTPLYQEFGVLFDALGKDTLPHLQQFGLAMDGSGKAEIGKALFFSVSAGTVFLPGIATFRTDPSQFTYLGSLFTTLGTTVAGLGGVASTIYTGSEKFFLDPGLRVSAGFALAAGLEVWGHFGIIPQVAMNAVGTLAKIEGLTLNRMNAGGRIRYVLVHDQKGLPAISLGVGYTYTEFNAGIDVTKLGLSAIPLGAVTLSIDGGAISAKTRLHTAGVELAISKKLLFVAPFLRMGAWYQWASYDAKIENLFISMTAAGMGTLSVKGYVAPTQQLIHDMSFVLTPGLEIILGKASLILQGSFDTASATPAASASFQFRI
jgi:hypothetical protein